ncbi:MAG: hypothetical protein ACE37F_08070 [Nannocystaceae bacterium]|nr:hypothetical protein [bacterium]
MTVQLHGASASVHDHVAQADGDFDGACEAIRTGDAVDVVTAVTRANVRNLAALAQWLIAPEQRPHLASWTMLWPPPQPVGLAIPRLGMVAPRVLHAAALARRAGLVVKTRGLPPCVLGPHVQHSVRDTVMDFAEPCIACAARGRCDGVPRAYIDAFAADLELRALR